MSSFRCSLLYIQHVHVLHVASIPGLLPPRDQLYCVTFDSTQKGGRGPGRFHHVMLAAGDITSYKQYILYAQYYSVLVIGRDVTRGKHHVMKSSRPCLSFLCTCSSVCQHPTQIDHGREKAWNRGYNTCISSFTLFSLSPSLPLSLPLFLPPSPSPSVLCLEMII